MDYKVIIFLAFLLINTGAFGQISISEINLANQYEQNKGYEIKIDGINEGDKKVLYVSYKIPDTLKALPVSFWGATNYTTPVVRIDSLIMSEEYLGERNDYHFYKYTFQTAFQLLALEYVTGEKASEIYDVFFDQQKLDIKLNTASTKLPVLERWLFDRVYYNPLGNNDSHNEWYVSYYSHDYSAAAPPMVVKKVDDKVIKYDSIFLAFNNVDILFNKKGLYLFQADTTSNQGYSWLLLDDSYPKYNTLEKLIEPLIYITTNEEYESLSRNNSKASFDRFWIGLGKNQSTAKDMIGRFYNRVEQANKYFTTYKEGWKTDKGMVFIVYGPPSRVTKTQNGEVWKYFNGEESQTFTFLRFSHVFYPYNYVLLRNEKFRRSWFMAVDLLRNGLY